MKHITSGELLLRLLIILPLLAILATGNAHAQETESVDEGAAELELAAEDAETLLEGVTVDSEDTAPPAFIDSLNSSLETTVGWVNANIIGKTIFLPIPIGGDQKVPLVLIVLVFAAVFFTLRFAFINIRAFRHGIEIVRGDYSSDDEEGDVTPFRALTSALSATVGLGNIAGVAIAIQTGGPGAVFWMTVMGLVGMSSKFTECTLAQMYRTKNPDGTINGGPMYYLANGLKDLSPSLGGVGKVLAVMFAVMVMLGALGGGNMFQANQSFAALQYVFEIPDKSAYVFGIFMMVLVGVVILGGITRIGAATSKIVPAMAGLYFLGALSVLVLKIGEVPSAIALIVSDAFTGKALAGGMIGALIQGIRRAAFSNEAGLGSAAIAHSAAKTKEPLREGFVALLEPFIDTVVICNLTALVIVLTGVWNDPSFTGDGVQLTKHAFDQVLPWFPAVLAGCVILFAYSTMISWCYYGERGWIFLADHFGRGKGLKTVWVFRIVFCAFVYIGTIANLGAVIDFSDGMIFSMAFPNLLGCVLLSGLVAKRLNEYWPKYKAGEFQKHPPSTKDTEATGSGI